MDGGRDGWMGCSGWILLCVTEVFDRHLKWSL